MAKWDDRNYVKAYELAKDGNSNRDIQKVLGCSGPTFQMWLKSKPALGEALEMARSYNSSKAIETFHDYVYEQLPPNLKQLLDEICAFEEEPNAILRVEKLLTAAGKRARQHLFLHSLVASNFNVSKACSRVNIDRTTFEHWVMREPEFAELMDEMTWHKKNFFEGSLVGLVARGDSSATIFANRTFNRDRGYNEKVTVEVEGQVNHIHAVISVDSLGLPIEVRKTILNAIRQQREEVPLLEHEDEDEVEDEEWNRMRVS